MELPVFTSCILLLITAGMAQNLGPENCYQHGKVQDGKCVCDAPVYFGEYCECHRPELAVVTGPPPSHCHSPKSTEVCSGHGECPCGVCICERRPHPSESYYGRYCECDNFTCPRHDGLLCSGPEKGECNCGKCQCSPGWTGEDCSKESSVTARLG